MSIEKRLDKYFRAQQVPMSKRCGTVLVIRRKNEFVKIGAQAQAGQDRGRPARFPQTQATLKNIILGILQDLEHEGEVTIHDPALHTQEEAKTA